MSILDVLKKKDPTSSWAPPPGGKLRLVLPEGRLDGVALGSPWQALEPFGKPGNKRPLDKGTLLYKERGLVLEVEEGVFEYLGLVFRDELKEGFSPCAALLDTASGTIELSADTRADELERLLGPPVKVDRDDDEEVREHRVGAILVETEHTLDDRLARLSAFLAE